MKHDRKSADSDFVDRRRNCLFALFSVLVNMALVFGIYVAWATLAVEYVMKPDPVAILDKIDDGEIRLGGEMDLRMKPVRIFRLRRGDSSRALVLDYSAGAYGLHMYYSLSSNGVKGIQSWHKRRRTMQWDFLDLDELERQFEVGAEQP